MDFHNFFDESDNDIFVPESHNINVSSKNDTFSINKKSQNKKSPLLYFSARNAVSQKFPFRSILLQYILENQSLKLQRKLQKCCKYFFLENPSLICDKLLTKNFSKNPIHFRHNTILINLLNFLQLPSSYSISVVTVLKFGFHENRFALSNLISNMIQKSDVEYVSIEHQNLCLNELKLLIGSGKVVELELLDVQIFDDDKKDDQVQLDKVLSLAPNVKTLKLSEFNVTTSTFQTSTNFFFNEKLKSIFIDSILNVENFDPKYLIQFLINNVSSQTVVDITINFPFLWEEIGDAMTACKNEILNLIYSCFPGKEKPQTSIHLYYE